MKSATVIEHRSEMSVAASGSSLDFDEVIDPP
jgi:hypothetical protein